MHAHRAARNDVQSPNKSVRANSCAAPAPVPDRYRRNAITIKDRSFAKLLFSNIGAEALEGHIILRTNPSRDCNPAELLIYGWVAGEISLRSIQQDLEPVVSCHHFDLRHLNCHIVVAGLHYDVGSLAIIG
jgi:hypothetical protein